MNMIMKRYMRNFRIPFRYWSSPASYLLCLRERPVDRYKPLQDLRQELTELGLWTGNGFMETNVKKSEHCSSVFLMFQVPATEGWLFWGQYLAFASFSSELWCLEEAAGFSSVLSPQRSCLMRHEERNLRSPTLMVVAPCFLPLGKGDSTRNTPH